MRLKRMTAALIAAAPLFAAAQTNVALYGVVDVAVESADAGNPGGRHTMVSSGDQSSSRVGFRGSEELGNGLKAIFNIEAGVSADTGAMDANGLFARRAVVGLAGDFGTLTLGREYSLVHDVSAVTDAFGQGFYGCDVAAFGTGRATRRLSNSVNYRSADWNGLNLLVAYSAGEQNTGPSGDLKGAGLEFRKGNLYLGAVYNTIKRVATGHDQEYAAGIAYKFDGIGGLEIKANYIAANPDGPNNKFEEANLGAGYPFGPGKFMVNLQQNRLETGARGNTWALAYTYTLSKRSNWYASYAHLNNNRLATFGLYSSANNLTPAATSLGGDPSVFALGLRHTF